MASLLCAAASGTMFAKWKQLSSHSRLRVWELYGWFCGLMFLGSMILALSIVAWAGFLVNFYAADSNPMNSASQTERISDDMYMAQVRPPLPLLLLPRNPALQQAYRWLVVYAITSPLTLGCLVVVKLLIIHRFAKFLDPRMQLTPRRLYILGRVLVAVAVFGSTVCFCCNAAAAAYFSRASSLYDSATNVNATDYNATIASAKQEVEQHVAPLKLKP